MVMGFRLLMAPALQIKVTSRVLNRPTNEPLATKYMNGGHGITFGLIKRLVTIASSWESP
jgi:hypothetical protein